MTRMVDGYKVPEEVPPNPCNRCESKLCKISGKCAKRKVYERICKKERIDYHYEDLQLGVNKPWLRQE